MSLEHEAQRSKPTLDITSLGDDVRLTPRQVEAAGYGSVSTLARKRMLGTGPEFIYDGRIHYKVSALRAYDAKCRRTSTTQATAA